MPFYRPPRPRRPWVPWVRALVVLLAVGGAGWGALELGHRYLGVQKLVIEQVTVTGCRSERLKEVQDIADRLCLGKPLFLFDAEGLRASVESLRWVKGLMIRKDPPDRLSLVIEERKPIVWLVRPTGVFLVSEDGIVLDRVHAGNLAANPVVADPASQSDASFLGVLRAARVLQSRQREFYDRLTELRWSDRGPVAFMEGLNAPIYLSKADPAKNIPNFQGLFLDRLSKSPTLSRLRYVDLRWDDEVAVGEPLDEKAPAPKGPAR